MVDIPLMYEEIEKLLCEDDDGINKLRERGFDPEGLPPDGDWGMTYLLIACEKGDLRVVRGLLDFSASTSATDEDGDTALLLVCFGVEEERAEVAECLLERADARTLIDSATTGGWGGWGSWGGWTALHNAAYWGNAAVVRVLLRFGADTTKLNKKGRTAAMLARKRREEEVAKLIEDHTALLALDEWRPWNHNEFPHLFREATKTILLLAKM